MSEGTVRTPAITFEAVPAENYPDLVHRSIRDACELFEPGGTVFNAAGFSKAFCDIAEIKGPLDGIVVRTMLQGRSDVMFHTNSDSHYSKATWRPA